jgi:hypothetical protein
LKNAPPELRAALVQHLNRQRRAEAQGQRTFGDSSSDDDVPSSDFHRSTRHSATHPHHHAQAERYTDDEDYQPPADLRAAADIEDVRELEHANDQLLSRQRQRQMMDATRNTSSPSNFARMTDADDQVGVTAASLAGDMPGAELMANSRNWLRYMQIQAAFAEKRTVEPLSSDDE